MGTGRYAAIAVALCLAIAPGGRTAESAGPHACTQKLFTYEIISPFRITPELLPASGEGFHDKTFELYGASEMGRNELPTYCSDSFLMPAGNGVDGLGISLRDADNAIFAERNAGEPVVVDGKIGMSFIAADQSYGAYDNMVIHPDSIAGISHHTLDGETGRTWIVPFSLPVKSSEKKASFLMPDAISIGLEIDYFRIADDVKTLGGGDLHFPSIIGKNRTGWISPESGLLRFEWRWGENAGN